MDYMTVDEASKKWGVSRSVVYRIIKTCGINTKKAGRVHLIDISTELTEGMEYIPPGRKKKCVFCKMPIELYGPCTYRGRKGLSHTDCNARVNRSNPNGDNGI